VVAGDHGDGSVAWTPLGAVGPSKRGDAVVAAVDGGVVLFGGTDFNAAFADTWTWDGTAWTEVADAGPSGRWSATAAALDGKVVLFGGTSGESGAELSDTWAWDGHAWTQLEVTGPSARTGAVMGTL